MMIDPEVVAANTPVPPSVAVARDQRRETAADAGGGEGEPASRADAVANYVLRRPALWVAGGVLLAALICTSCTWAARNDAMSGSGARGGGPLASFATFFDWFAANAGVYVTISILILVLILGIGWAARRWEESLRPVIDVHFLDPSGAPGLTVKSVPLGGSPDLPSSVGRIGQQFSGRDEAGRLRQLDLPLNSEFGEFETVRVGRGAERRRWVRRYVARVPLRQPLRCQAHQGRPEPCVSIFDPFSTDLPRCCRPTLDQPDRGSA